MKGVRNLTYEQILESFKAFNVNSMNSLAYTVKTNIWILLTIIGAVILIILNVREEIEDYVPEEIDIL